MLGTKRIRKNRGRVAKRPHGGVGKHRLALGMSVLAGLLGVIVLSVSFIFVHDAVTQCDYFRSKQIIITGADRLTDVQIMQQARVVPHTNILAINLNLVRKRLLLHPWIADAQVTRELPDTLVIRIREHRPLAVLDLGGDFIINTDGEVFKAWEPSDPENLPRVTGLAFSDIRLPLDDGSPAFDALVRALHLGQDAHGVLPNRHVQRIHVDRDLGLTLYAFDETKVVKLGFRNFQEKLRRLETLLYRLDQQQDWTGFDAIDLVNLNRVVVIPARGETLPGHFKEGFGAGT